LRSSASAASISAFQGIDIRTVSTVFVSLCFAALFTMVPLILLLLAELSLKSPSS